jgi:benzodiazapine receptor
MRNGSKLLISLLIPQVVAITAARFTITGVGSWYQQIRRPSWNPPGWVFGPVWTTLYIMMGVVLYLLWKEAPAGVQKRGAIGLWAAQLFFNFCWSLLFFNQHRIGVALIDLLLLWILILLTIFAFAKFNKVAAWLLVPYIAWVTFAGILNYSIWILNKPTP